MEYKNKNFSRSHINELTAQNGDSFIRCNFSQSVPNTVILSGITGITFEKCNLMNCSIPGDATKVDCLHAQKSLCSHLHPNRLAAGEITECNEDCEHVDDDNSVQITINGGNPMTYYKYKDLVV